jgi:hypothetical protein
MVCFISAVELVLGLPLIALYALFESRRRVTITLTDDALFLNVRSALGRFEMRWDRQRITRLRRCWYYGIWVYYGDETQGRIPDGTDAQQDWLLRILRGELRIDST